MVRSTAHDGIWWGVMFKPPDKHSQTYWLFVCIGYIYIAHNYITRVTTRSRFTLHAMEKFPITLLLIALICCGRWNIQCRLDKCLLAMGLIFSSPIQLTMDLTRTVLATAAALSLLTVSRRFLRPGSFLGEHWASWEATWEGYLTYQNSFIQFIRTITKGAPKHILCFGKYNSNVLTGRIPEARSEPAPRGVCYRSWQPPHWQLPCQCQRQEFEFWCKNIRFKS